jgi:RNA ligase (TIGR02306 family)
MSSSLIVPIVELENVREHPNADSLELADILGYQIVIPKGKFKSGDQGVYFPADTVIPEELAEKLNVTNYLKGKDVKRISKISLRGEPSFGLFIEIPDHGKDWEVGQNVAEEFGASKYIPPINPHTSEEIAKYNPDIDPYFEGYTDIENGRIFTNIFNENEEIVITEKIHGTNSRIGIIGNKVVAGSHRTRKKWPVNSEGHEIFFQDMGNSIYWFPFIDEQVVFLLNHLSERFERIIIYGEIFGKGIQSKTYGLNNSKDYRIFDIKCNGKYLDFEELEKLCSDFKVNLVPVLYKGIFDLEVIKKYAEHNSVISKSVETSEGVVVKPVKERIDPKIGRVILKYISNNFSLKNKDQDFTDV